MIKAAAAGVAFVIVLFAALSIGLWLKLGNTQKQIAALQIDRERLETAVESYKIVLAGKDDAIAELERENKDALNRRTMLEVILKEIRSAPEKDNGKIAPVLERALRRLDAGGMRKPQPKRAARPIRH